MPIEIHKNGGYTITGKQGMTLFRLLTMLSGLRLEVRCPGLRLTRGVSCYALAKKEFGFKGNKEKVLAQLEAYVQTQQASVPRIYKGADHEAE